MLKNAVSPAFFMVSADPIAERAHEIYVDRGRADGSDLDDWLRAEREINSTPAAAPTRASPRVRKRSHTP